MRKGLEHRLGLRLRVLLFFAFLGLVNVGLICGAAWLGATRLDPANPGAALALIAVMAGFGTLGMTLWIWFLFDQNVARPIINLSNGLRARVHAGVDMELDAAAARYLGDLGGAAKAVTSGLTETRNELAIAVKRETGRLATEKGRLEALLADVPAGVLLCSAEHQIVFYNGTAQMLLTGSTGSGAALSSGAALNRALTDSLRGGALAAAQARLDAAVDPDAQTRLICTTVDGRMLDARMRLVSVPGADGSGQPGYALTLRDVTSDLALHAGREALLEEVFDRMRRPAANLRTMIGAHLADTPEGLAALTAEADSLAAALMDLGNRFDRDRGQWWPMESVPAEDMIASVSSVLRARGLSATTDCVPVSLRLDAVQIGTVLADLIGALTAEHGATALTLRIAPEDAAGSAMAVIGWEGGVLPLAKLDAWLARPLDPTQPDLTGARVLSLHGTAIWPETGRLGRAILRLPLRAEPACAPAADRRAAVYDFRLLERQPVGKLADTPLRDLEYVVFDTETTGLLPSAGDEIVQLAALRMVGAKPVPGEVYDTFVNPKRSIPKAATEVHHVTEEMVADAPDIATVGAIFHHFAESAVLVAHNAPFDMAFLRKHAKDIGKRFDNPVVDTVLFSAVLFGMTEVHTLDALTERLGITIPEEARHTAMGDTIATAAALEKMIPMAESRGIHTFGDLLKEMRRNSRLLEDLNTETA